jgi:hypothetical protein
VKRSAGYPGAVRVLLISTCERGHQPLHLASLSERYGGDVAACTGLLAKAAVAAAQAVLAGRGEWALSEAGIVRRAGLDRAESIIAATGDRPLDLERAVWRMRVALRAAGGGL